MSLTAALPGYDDWLTRGDPANSPESDEYEDTLSEYWSTPSVILDAIDANIPELDKPVCAVRAVFDPCALTTAQLLVALFAESNQTRLMQIRDKLRERIEDTVDAAAMAYVMRGH